MDDYKKQIEQLKRENEQLLRANQRLQEKLNVALDGNGLCLWEQHVPSGTLTIFNMEWGKMLGYQPNELTATVDTWKSNLHPDDYDLAVGAFEDHISGKTDLYQVIHRMVHKDGSDSWVSDRGRVVEYDEHGAPIRMMGTHIDITQEKRYEIQLAKLANSDPLTGVLNRIAIEDEFDNQLQKNQHKTSALIFIDIDNFKNVNDQSGHQAGDRLLIEIAEGLVRVAPNNARVGRLGGDEFVILCGDCKQEQASQLCTAVLNDITPSINSNNNAEIGFSIGACLFSGVSHEFADIYQRADQAMYDVKNNGKNDFAVVELDDLKPLAEV